MLEEDTLSAALVEIGRVLSRVVMAVHLDSLYGRLDDALTASLLFLSKLLLFPGPYRSIFYYFSSPWREDHRRELAEEAAQPDDTSSDS